MGSRPRDSTRASRTRSAVATSPKSSGARRRNSRHVVPHSYIPVEIQDVFDRERRRLRQASAVLSCLRFAALYREWHEEIDTADVADLVHGLIDRALIQLDGIELARSARELSKSDASEDD